MQKSYLKVTKSFVLVFKGSQLYYIREGSVDPVINVNDLQYPLKGSRQQGDQHKIV